MSTRWIVVIVLLLILLGLSESLKLTCEIPSVEAGDDATLTFHFDKDLSNEKSMNFRILHFKHDATVSQVLRCNFNNGKVECDNTSCCTWERKVADVFRVNMHNMSQEHEGDILGDIDPPHVVYQEYCTFALKADTCPTDLINVTNSHMSCTTQLLPVGQTCIVTCNYGQNYQDSQTSAIYTCIGKNKWFPEMPKISCEADTCPTDLINVTNSHMSCTTQLLPVGQTCIVTCNYGQNYQDSQTAIYTCIGKNKWSPEMPKISCEEPRTGHGHEMLLYIWSLLIMIPVVFIMYLFKKRCDKRKLMQLEECEGVGLLRIPSTEVQHSAEDYWLQCIRTWYPELQSRVYFLPPIHFHSVRYNQPIIAGHQVLVPNTIQDYDQKNNTALQHVLQCLRALADNSEEKEVMMVISQLQFGKYIGQPCYAPAATLLLKQSSLREEFNNQYDKGDFDILIIHKQYGLLTLEIKSVGGNFSQVEMTEQNQDNVVMDRVKKAVKQLSNSENVLKQITSKYVNNIHITKILVLPNISSSQLRRAISRTPDHEQFLCQYFGVQNVDDAVKLCLLSDQLSDKHMSSDGNNSSHQALGEWWQHIVKLSGPEQLMTSSLYEQLVARFCGPATTVEVHCVTAPRLNIRTLGEAVSETGERVARLVLFPQQVDILNQSPSRAFLTGPPGTGKTIVLIMQGITWLQRAHDVHIFSTWDESCAVTIVIKYQLQETANTTTARSRVHRHQFDLRKDGEVETAVSCLKSLSKRRQLCVIADEVVRDYRESFSEFCEQLSVHVPGVFIWGASVYHDIRPLYMEEVKLTTPLRSPPVVFREVIQTKEIKELKQVHDYTVSDFPVPTDGPSIMRIEHCDGQLCHTGFLPLDCIECGHEVAHVLTKLDVGRTGSSNGPPPLQYRDVLVLSFLHPTDDRVKSFGLNTTTASGLVRGLRDCHVPVRVVEKDDEAAIRDMALGVGDLVTVANWDDVRGLERKVVVVERGIGVYDWFDRFQAMSRCTSQLVLIDWISV